MDTEKAVKATGDFWQLSERRKCAALDIHRHTGEVVLICSVSKDGKRRGDGKPGISYGPQWVRVLETAGGRVWVPDGAAEYAKRFGIVELAALQTPAAPCTAGEGQHGHV